MPDMATIRATATRLKAEGIVPPRLLVWQLFRHLERSAQYEIPSPGQFLPWKRVYCR